MVVGPHVESQREIILKKNEVTGQRGSDKEGITLEDDKQAWGQVRGYRIGKEIYSLNLMN